MEQRIAQLEKENAALKVALKYKNFERNLVELADHLCVSDDIVYDWWECIYMSQGPEELIKELRKFSSEECYTNKRHKSLHECEGICTECNALIASVE
jgi:hypothetical protein